MSFALSTKSVASGLSLRRSTPSVARTFAVPAVHQKRVVCVRAEPETTPSTTPATDETLQKIQAQAEDALKFVKEKWDNTDNSEKPAAVAIIVGVIVAQIAIGATVDAIDKIPIVNKGLQLIGLAVTAFYLYRYGTDPEERADVKKSVESFITQVTGK